MLIFDLVAALLLAGGTGLAFSLVPLRRSTPSPGPSSRKEERRLEGDIPFLLERIASALSAGHSLQQAISLTTRSPGSPGARLFLPILERVEAGQRLEDALRQEVSRFHGRSIPLPLLTMSSALRSGANLVESLHTLSRVARERETMRKKVEALSAQGRLQGLILCLTPFLFLAALGLVSPGSLSLILHSGLGRLLLLAALLLDGAGSLIIRRMVGREVLP